MEKDPEALAQVTLKNTEKTNRIKNTMTYFTLTEELNEMNLFHSSGANQNGLDLHDGYKEIIEKSADRITKDIDTNKTGELLPNYSHALVLERLTFMMSHCYATAKVKDNKHAPGVKEVKTIDVNEDEMTNKVGGKTLPSSPVFEYIKRLEEIKTNGSQRRNDDNKIFDSKDVHIVNQICLYELESILLSHSKVRITDEGRSYCDKNYRLLAMDLKIFFMMYDLFIKENHGSKIQNSYYKKIKIFILKSRITQIENIRDTTEPHDLLINTYNMMIEQIETQALTEENNRSSSILFKKSAAPKISEIELTLIKKQKDPEAPAQVALKNTVQLMQSSNRKD
jgi:hypothetical protein